MEKFIEEIRLIWCEECADGPLSYEFGYDPEVDEACTSGAEDLCTERAKKAITHIGLAYADGELELPGETGDGGERRMHLATRLENMGYQLHSPHKGWLITRVSSVSSLPTLDEVEVLVERLEKNREE